MTTKRLFFLLKIVIALITMFILLKTVHFKEIYSAIRNPLNPSYIWIACILVLPNIFIQCSRWYYMLGLVRPDISMFETISSFFGGLVVGFVTPGRIGEVGRSLYIKRGDHLQIVGLVFIEKFYSFLTVVMGGIWGMVFMFGYLFHFAPFIMWPLVVVGFLTSLVALAIALHPQWIRSFLYNISVLLPARDKLQRLMNCFDQFKVKQARIYLVYTIIFYLIYIFQFSFLGLAFSDVVWPKAMIASTATIFTKTLLPISFADLGVREGAAVYYYMKFHVDKVAAFNSSMLLFAINVVLPTLLGIFFIPRLGWKEGTKKQKVSE